MGQVEFIDKSGELRPADDYVEAQRFFEEKLVKYRPGDEPGMILHGVVAIEALKVMAWLAAVQELGEKERAKGGRQESAQGGTPDGRAD